MAREKNKLTDTAVKQALAKESPYKLFDGGGLHLLIKPNGTAKGAKYWHMKYHYNGAEKSLSLGVYPEISLAAARKELAKEKAILKSGLDPSQQRQLSKLKSRISATNSFEAVAREWHQMKITKWEPEHAKVILRRLENNVFPVIGTRPVSELETVELIFTLEQATSRGALVLAGQLRQYIKAIMTYAIQTSRIKHNPALDLQGALVTAKTTHRPALPLEELPTLIQRIESYSHGFTIKHALQFALLTGARSSEFRFSIWNEFDLEKGLWTIPPERVAVKGVKHSNRGEKMHTARIIPLASQTVALLQSLHRLTGRGQFVFQSEHKQAVPISENTPNKAIRLMGYDTAKDICLHGFRTMACSAMNESGLWNRDAIERHMGHQERDKVRAAYMHKAEYLEERKQMLQWWSNYLEALASGQFILPAEFQKNRAVVYMATKRK